MSQQKKGGRRRGRRRAFEVLYGLSFNEIDSIDSLKFTFDNAPERSEENEPTEEGIRFAWKLTAGVWTNGAAIDETITKFSRHWKLKRIARIELTILRVALYEMLYMDDIPLKVAINEAVELAKSFGDDNSKNFVNGILDAVAKAIENGELRAD